MLSSEAITSCTGWITSPGSPNTSGQHYERRNNAHNRKPETHQRLDRLRIATGIPALRCGELLYTDSISANILEATRFFSFSSSVFSLWSSSKTTE